MRNFYFYGTGALINLMLIAGGIAVFAQAPDTGVQAKGAAYAFQTAPSQRNGAVFVELVNTGATDAAVVKAATDKATRVELHSMAMDEEGVMEMRRLDRVPLPVGRHVTLSPMGDHIMLIGLQEPLAMGDVFPVTLTLDDGRVFNVSVSVVAPGTHPNGDADTVGHGHGHDQHHEGH